MSTVPEVSAESLYKAGENDREPFLRAARDNALLTQPYLIPEYENQKEDDLAKPFQSVGSDGVNNLSASLLLALFPSNEPFFRFEITPEGKDEIEEQTGGRNEAYQKILSEMKVSFSEFERRVIRRIEKERLRPGMGEAMKHLLVAGNVVLDYGESRNDIARVFRMDQYVCERLGNGEVFRIILREEMLVEGLSEELAELIQVGSTLDQGDVSTKDNKYVYLYTVVQLTNPLEGVENEYLVWQELGDKVIEDTIKEYTAASVPIRAHWFTRNYGGSYSLGYIDQYSGDLRSVEGLSEAQVEGAALAARAITGVDPAGYTNANDVRDADNLDVIEMREQDVFVLQAEKAADMRVVLETLTMIIDRLNRAFLIAEGSIRQAERVTAEEIRLLRQAIERKLGNVYAILTDEVQMPLLDRILHQMIEDGELPKEIQEGIDYIIVAGVDSLARAQDFERLKLFLSSLREVVGEQALPTVINQGELVNRLATLTGVSPDNLVRSEAEIRESMQQRQQLELASRVGPEVVKQVGGAVQTQNQAAADAEATT